MGKKRFLTNFLCLSPAQGLITVLPFDLLWLKIREPLKIFAGDLQLHR